LKHRFRPSLLADYIILLLQCGDFHQRDPTGCMKKLMREREFHQVCKWAHRIANKATDHNDINALIRRIYLVVDLNAEEIKGNLISHMSRTQHMECIYLNETARNPPGTAWLGCTDLASFFTFGESKRSLPSGLRNFESLFGGFSASHANTRILRFQRKNVWVARDYVCTKRSSSTPRENETSRVTVN